MKKSEFLKQGFLLCQSAIPNELLNKWRTIADQIEQKALEAHTNGGSVSGVCVIDDPVGSRVMRADDLFLSHTDELLELLATDKMVEIMRHLCGERALIIQTDLLFKHQHPHPVIRWHQGAPHSRNYPYLNVGIYLDDADQDDGCLRYVPGTQFEMQPIEQLEEEHGWNPPGVVQQPAKAGDILVQDMMILHSSEPKRSPGARRTIYVEIRPYDAVLEEKTVSKEWIDLRKYWTGKILSQKEQSHFSTSELAYFETDKMPLERLTSAMVAEHYPPIPAVYSTRPVTGPDYPVPADLMEEDKRREAAKSD